MKMQIATLLGALVLGCFSLSPTWADVIYVNGSADGANTGDSWDNAYRNLQSALASAQNGDEIWVAAGVYKPTDGSDRTASFMMRDGVSLYGGFAGGEISIDLRDWIANETILSGDIGEQNNNSNNSINIVRGANDLFLDGFTITDGSGGSAMFNRQCNPTIANCTFMSNLTGGIQNNGGTVIVTNCNFIENVGGGLGNASAATSVYNCLFIGNSSNGGGGMNNSESTVTVTDCIFKGNAATFAGGAINGYHSNQTLTNCTFVGNSAEYGGGVYHRGNWGKTELINCTLSGNVATYNGGGIYYETAKPSSVVNSILWDNRGVNGSQIYIYNTEVSVSHSDIQGGIPGDGNIDANPLFTRDPSPGIDGEWGTEDDDYGDLSLQHGSPCIDAGAEVGLDADIEGNVRPFDYPYVDNNSGVSDFDMGAYERTDVPGYAITVLSPNGGELFAQGSIHNIVWGTSHEMPISDVVIEFSTDGGESWMTIDTVENSGTYEWIVPTANSTHCVISVGDLLNPTISDSSDSGFTVFECVEPIPGDVNGDCYVNMADIAVIADNWLRCGNAFDPLCEGL